MTGAVWIIIIIEPSIQGREVDRTEAESRDGKSDTRYFATDYLLRRLVNLSTAFLSAGCINKYTTPDTCSLYLLLAVLSFTTQSLEIKFCCLFRVACFENKRIKHWREMKDFEISVSP